MAEAENRVTPETGDICILLDSAAGYCGRDRSMAITLIGDALRLLAAMRTTISPALCQRLAGNLAVAARALESRNAADGAPIDRYKAQDYILLASWELRHA